MAYRNAEARSAAGLEQKVAAPIAEGWLPSGGLAVATYAAGAWRYYRALVLRTTSA